MQLTATPPINTLDPWAFTDGLKTAEVLVVSEYFNGEEAVTLRPMKGSTGYEFRKMLAEAGIAESSCLFAVVAAIRPPGGDPAALVHPTPRSKKGAPATTAGLYAKRELADGFARICALVRNMPNLRLIIGAGNLPLWALTDKCSISTQRGVKLPGGVSKWRGSQLYSTIQSATGHLIPYLPVIHPSTIQRDWTQRYITVHDLKARGARYLSGATKWDRQVGSEKYFPNPNYTEAITQLQRWEARLSLGELWLSADIETWRRKVVTCIGIADADTAWCFPFFYFGAEGEFIDVYSPEEEAQLWLAIRRVLSHPNARIIGQNFIYDDQFLYRQYAIAANLHLDTMLAHHLLWPGTPKGLDYLASLYCNHYVYWKDESNDWTGQFNHEQLWRYNCKDVRETYDIGMELQKLIPKLGLESQWALQLDQWHLAKAMMRKGVNVNHRHFDTIRESLGKIAANLEEWLLAAMPADIRYTDAGGPWFSSPAMQMRIFYDLLGLPIILHKKTKRPTFDTTAIGVLKERTPWLEGLFERLDALRSIGVFRSHFLEMQLSFDKRLRCNFNVGGTETFRWSSSANGFGEGTNFQNIPKGDD